MLNTRTALLFVLLFSLACCQYPKTWELDRLQGCRAVDSAARLSAYATTHGPKFQLEWLQNVSGEKLFVNAYCLEFPYTGQIVLQAGEQQETFLGYVYMGGQKLLLPDEARDFAREALLGGTPIIITVGCYSGVVDAEGFAEKYACLKQIEYLFMDCCPPRGMM